MPPRSKQSSIYVGPVDSNEAVNDLKSSHWAGKIYPRAEKISVGLFSFSRAVHDTVVVDKTEDVASPVPVVMRKEDSFSETLPF